MQIYPLNNKIKVLRIISRLNIGGPSVHAVLLNRGLAQRGFESLLVAGSEGPLEGSMREYAHRQGVNPFFIADIENRVTLKYRDLRAMLRLYQLIQRERPHIVHTHTAKAGLMGRMVGRSAGVPVVVHTYHGHVLHGYFNPVKTWLLRRMEQALAHCTDGIITVSERVKCDLLAYGVATADKMHVIPLGFDFTAFTHTHGMRGDFRREWQIDPATRLVGIVGRIVPIKNHHLFLEAAAHIAATHPDVQFVIVGDGELRERIKEYASELGLAGRVIFTGWLHDMPQVYRDLDVLVVASKNEGTPVTAIEAMVMGCPVVATKVGGLPDMIIDGINGCLVLPHDATQLAERVLYLLHHPKEAQLMSQHARVQALNRYTLPRLLEHTEAFYHRLLIQKGYAFQSSIGHTPLPGTSDMMEVQP